MRPRTTPATRQQHASDDALAKLLTAESRLAAQLEAAREEAADTLRQARADAKRTDDACAATIEASSAKLATEYASHVEAEVANIAREAQLISAHFEAVDSARLSECVALVVERLLTPLQAERST